MAADPGAGVLPPRPRFIRQDSTRYHPRMLDFVEQQRSTLHARADRDYKARLGQFMTPATVARFMADLFKPTFGDIRLLDAGAGLGALSCAVLNRWQAGQLGGHASVVAHEIDERLRPHLVRTLAGYFCAKTEVRAGDFLEEAAAQIEAGRRPFTHAILNPPYKKIGTGSDAREHARRIGLETVNLYSAFVGAALALLEPQGQLVAIIPRSFCNGPYYRPFRDFLFAHAAIEHIHLLDSRSSAFSDDDVLQENIIIRLVRDGQQGRVKITRSRDHTFSNQRSQVVPFSQVVHPRDPGRFIYIPDGTPDPLRGLTRVRSSLADLGLSVSTGPVVDFRLREYLRKMPEKGTVPLIYPAHLDGLTTTWPLPDIKKWNAIERNDDTQRWLFPGGTYVLLRRFSSKEEKRRLHVSLLRHEQIDDAPWIGFENHTNVFHIDRRGLSLDVALGLFCWLHSTALDEHLRRFSGHTQVNATDLRNMPYPAIADLKALGKRLTKRPVAQQEIDHLIGEVLA